VPFPDSREVSEEHAFTNAGKAGNRLVGVNLAAQKAGLRPGMLLTDATAIAPDLRAVQQDR
jgi:hypothetical protein